MSIAGVDFNVSEFHFESSEGVDLILYEFLALVDSKESSELAANISEVKFV